MTAYADTSWWVAYKNASDSQHKSAVRVFDRNSDIVVLWTPWQRVEVFNSFRQLERAGSLPRHPAAAFIRALENEVRLGYWPHVEFEWTDAVRTANELSAVHSRDYTIRAMDLFHVAIACEVGAEQLLTFDEDQASLAEAAGLVVWKGT
jgi:predicted nucleic acid-binding protein